MFDVLELYNYSPNFYILIMDMERGGVLYVKGKLSNNLRLRKWILMF